MCQNGKKNAALAITQGQVGVRNDPIDDLAIAVVRLAAEDYRSFQKRKRTLEKRIKKTEGIKKHDATVALSNVEYQIGLLEKFFKSDWCFALSGGTNIAILERLRREQENE